MSDTRPDEYRTSALHHIHEAAHHLHLAWAASPEGSTRREWYAMLADAAANAAVKESYRDVRPSNGPVA